MATTTAQKTGETLELLHDLYENLTKAGTHSLSAAYRFGNVVQALHGIFSYKQMAAELGVTPTTVSKYHKLFDRYPTEKALLDTAGKLGVYDVGILARDDVPVRYSYTFHCNNCGSDDISKDRHARALGTPGKAAVPSVQFSEN